MYKIKIIKKMKILKKKKTILNKIKIKKNHMFMILHLILKMKN